MVSSGNGKVSASNPTGNRSVFILLGGHNYWEGLYDNRNIGLIVNLNKHQLLDQTDVVMTTIVPRNSLASSLKELLEKEEVLRQELLIYGAKISFVHIQGRTIKGLFRARIEIRQLIMSYEKRFIWAMNYFNCFLGINLKRQLPGTHLHFEVLGLVPEEELYYSDSGVFSRYLKFLVLRILERIDVENADSISVVSRRFKAYFEKKYSLHSTQVEVIPCNFDPAQFFQDDTLREKTRKEYQIKDNQKLVFYSGMLQKWQEPELMFEFMRKIQSQDVNQEFRFLVLTFDQQKAHKYMARYRIKDLIINSARQEELNSIYNAADIGIAFRSTDMVSYVSSPVKIPEYLATGNSLIFLEHIGDYGEDLKNKDYALVKKNHTDLMNTTIAEIKSLKKPDSTDMNEIQEKFSILSNLATIKRIIEKYA